MASVAARAVSTWAAAEARMRIETITFAAAERDLNRLTTELEQVRAERDDAVARLAWEIVS